MLRVGNKFPAFGVQEICWDAFNTGKKAKNGRKESTKVNKDTLSKFLLHDPPGQWPRYDMSRSGKIKLLTVKRPEGGGRASTERTPITMGRMSTGAWEAETGLRREKI